MPRLAEAAFCEGESLPKRIEMPEFIKPQLATLKSKAPKGEQWLHEFTELEFGR